MIIEAINGSLLEKISEFKLDGIMNAANGIGPMGAGIAGAIRKAGGVEIQSHAFKVCEKLNPQRGDAYFTTAGSLEEQGVKYIIHAVTMKSPGEHTTYNVINKAFKAGLALAKDKGITRIGCTALGTGVGGLDTTTVAGLMTPIADQAEIEVVFMDYNFSFIQKIHTLIKGGYK